MVARISSLSLAFVTALAVVQLDGCTQKRAIFGCACGTDADCTGGQLCDSCACHPPCTSQADCHVTAPNCDPDSGRCLPACKTADDCPKALPNCGTDGLCFAACTSHSDCKNPAFPNCDLDPTSATAGICQSPCTKDLDCPSTAYPNCNTAKGTCEPPCTKNNDCFTAAPNCDATTGMCYGPCSDDSGCTTVSNAPVCDPDTGLCQGSCPTAPCPTATPRCDSSSGLCQPPCQDGPSCAGSAPNCNPTTGKCYASCSNDSGCNVVTGFPNCEPTSGVCKPSCTANSDCPTAAKPNCAADGTCFAPCDATTACTNSAFPDCDLDASSTDAGLCEPACTKNADCIAISSAYPNCNTVTGICSGPCAVDGDCPNGGICDTSTDYCSAPQCTADADCDFANTGNVCESGRCVPGCTQNSDCLPDRCRLTGPQPNHCEARDCTADADCSAPLVCDTDGLADATGGGYCVAACTTYDDCPEGYDCLPRTVAGTTRNACLPHDYGDVGTTPPTFCAVDATSGNKTDCSVCTWGQGVPSATGSADDVCTKPCCSQHDCPAGYGCRPVPDSEPNSPPASVAGFVDECVPLGTSSNTGRRNTSCNADSDCRSNVCRGTSCRDTCCNNSGCGTSDACLPAYTSTGADKNVTACLSGSQATDLGTLNTSGSNSFTCNAGLWYLQYQTNTGCSTAADCTTPYYNSVCENVDPSPTDTTNDCAYAYCVAPCCSISDCQNPVTPSIGPPAEFFCGAANYTYAGDMDICVVNINDVSYNQGQPCPNGNSDCGSLKCDTTQTPAVCLGRLPGGSTCSDDRNCLSTHCDPPSSGSGPSTCRARAPAGTACTADTECASNYCVADAGATTSHCRQRCCTDADCSTTQHCKVAEAAVHGQKHQLLFCLP